MKEFLVTASHGLLASSHLCLLLFLSALWLYHRSKAGQSPPRRVVNHRFSHSRLALFTSLSLGLFHLFSCILNYYLYPHDDWFFSIQVELAITALAWFALSSYLLLELGHSNEDRFPTCLRIWWFLFLLFSCTCLVMDFLYLEKHQFLKNYFWISDSCSVLAGLILNYAGLFGKRIPIENPTIEETLLNGSNVNGSSNGISDCQHSISPFENAGSLSILSFSWVSPLLSVGRTKAIDLKDVPQLASNDNVQYVLPNFQRNLEAYTRAHGTSVANGVTSFQLAEGIIFTAWKQIVLTAFLALLSAVAACVGPYLINSVVRYLSGDRQFKHEGYFLVSAFILSEIVEALSDMHRSFRLQQVSIRIKASLVAMIYQKGLTLSSHSSKNAELINYVTVDAGRIGAAISIMHNVWLIPMRIVLALFILYPVMGFASLIALAASFAVMLANIPLAKLEEYYTKKTMESKDCRIKATSEILRNMKVLKLQAWEMKFLSKIMELRKNETNWLWKSEYAYAAINFLFSCSSILISVVAFVACVLMGIPLETGKVLTAIASLRMLRGPIFSLPNLISTVVKTKVSFDRISSFLCREGLQPNIVQKIPRGSSDVAIEVTNGDFSWDPSSETPTLKNLNFEVLHGMKVAVCGTVGSGKSSLLSCILGEVSKISGTVKLCGTTAYVSQSPWILSGSIQDNIIFGKEMDRDKYERVLEACCLKKDLEIMPSGDQTVIGERGINLSGGQKQRVQIARAIYHDADIYLFDDPFSAVDVHTGSHLFKECLLRFLDSKTVVYVTHQVEFLPSADLILVIEDGRIVQAGKYSKILESEAKFMEHVAAHIDDLTRHSMGKDSSNLSINNNDFGSSDPKSSPEISQKEELEDEGNGKSDETMAKGQIIQEEERAKGQVGFWVYWEYITMAYKGALVPLIILAQILYHILNICSNYWMASETPISGDLEPTVSASTLLSVYVALNVGSAACYLINALLIATVGFKTATLLFNKMHACIFRAPMSFFDSTPSGRILDRASQDQNAVDTSIPFLIGYFPFLILRLLGIVGVMSQVVLLILFISIPVIGACIWYQQYYISTSRELARLLGVCQAPLVLHFSETMSGLSSVRSFGQEKEFVDTNYKLSNDLSRLKFHSSGATGWLSFRLVMLSTLTFAMFLIFLICMPDNLLDPGIAGLAVTYALNLNSIQSAIIWFFCHLENRTVSVERILQYTDIPCEPPLSVDENKPNQQWPARGNVDLLNLQVRYRPNMPFVLRGLTCNFPGGRKTGIVGRTGSGKSTLIQTIFRILDPTVGRIFIDGIDISTIGLHDLRSRLSIIPQDPVMFEGTIRNNLDPLEEYTEEQIWEALDCCQLGEEIRKNPLKLDSTVTESGENWSVGQRQLVCLGRVLLKKTKILVLDEATASVDTATDSIIQRTLRQQFSESTVIAVAHRITSVIDSDMILLLDNGVVVEHDTPARLLENESSSFAKLVAEHRARSRDGFL